MAKNSSYDKSSLTKEELIFFENRKLKDKFFIGKFKETKSGYQISDIRRSDFSKIKYKPKGAKVFVIETEETGLVEFINPEILETLGKQVGQEGCLSVPERYGDVERPAIVKVKAFDRNGKEFEMVAKKLAARAVCHENDHLDGFLYIDREIKAE